MDLLQCPVCLDPLHRDGGSLKCAENHTFDVAREGYVNLLLPQHRRSREPGDNSEMVAARARFLDAGHYEPLAKALLEIASARHGPTVDLGCGDGYFTAYLAAAAMRSYGIDVSKPAIRAACRRSRETTFVVASMERLPLVSASFGAAAAIMAPVGADVHRVIRRGGALVRVSPAADHLKELKEILYAEARPHVRAAVELPGFTLSASTRLTSRLAHLSPESRADLIAMTPMKYRSTRERQTEVEGPDRLSVTSDFWIDAFDRV